MKLMMIAGEVSGDQHGAHLMGELKAHWPDAEIYGIGGYGMIRQGLRPYDTLESLQVHGLVELIPHLPRLYQILWNLRDSLDDEKPDAVILIDYPAFNLKMAAYAKQRGIPVFFFSSPQIWAWRRGRIHKIKKVVDHMLLLFPFEKPIYDEAQIPATFVGNPLVKEPPPTEVLEHFTQQHKMTEAPKVALLPGSRQSEVDRHLPVLLETLELLQQQKQEAHFMLPVASNLDTKALENALKPYSVRLIHDQFEECIHAADAAIVCSGTASLQVGLAQTPMMIIYKVSPVSFWLAKKLAQTPHIGMVNIIAGKEVVREFLQNDLTAENLCAELKRLLHDTEYRQTMQDNLQKVRHSLQSGNVYQKAAEVIQQEIKSRLLS